MGWLLGALMQAALIVLGIRRQRGGAWGQHGWGLVLAFTLLESALLLLPIICIDLHSAYFLPVLGCTSLVAGLNFVWFVRLARHG